MEDNELTKHEKRIAELFKDEFTYESFVAVIEGLRDCWFNELDLSNDTQKSLTLIEKRKGALEVLHKLLSLRNSAKQEDNADEESVNPKGT